MLLIKIIGDYFRDFFKYKELVLHLTIQDLKVRYKTAVLGFLWTLLNPLFIMVVFSIVFSFIVKIKVDKFPVFVLCALMPWFFFSNSLSNTTTSIVDNANLIKKIFFPRKIIPFSIILVNLFNFLLSLMVLFIFLFAFKVSFNVSLILLPVIIMIQFIFIFGISLIFSSLQVFYRDVRYIVQVLLVCWFYLSPIFYPVSMVPAKFQKIYILNPMASLTVMFRDIMLYGKLPSFGLLFLSFVTSVAFFLIGATIFKKNEDKFVDFI